LAKRKLPEPMSLTSYNQKRNFTNTPEPEGEKQSGKDDLTFVVQRHHASHLHYDFRLEMEGVLKSWAVPKGPSMIAGEKRLAVMVEDHPLDYGKFFGEIPKGNYGAGTVEIWDEGSYETIENVAAAELEKSLLAQLKKGDLKLRLNGHYLKGTFALVRMNDDSGKNWLLIKKEDDFSLEKFDINAFESLKNPKEKNRENIKPEKKKKLSPESDKLAAKQLAVSVAWKKLSQPMLALAKDEALHKTGWIFELKFDGYRAITKIERGMIEMVSRNGNSFNNSFVSLVNELKSATGDVILDGEVVIEDDTGISNFQLLQNFKTTQKGILKYYVFDILFVNGYVLTSMPLIQRKELLDSFFENNSFKNIHKSLVYKEEGEKLFVEVTNKGFEGIIAKDPQSIYQPGKRSESWLKIKKSRTIEAVIAGYSLPQNSRKYFGSLLLGIYDGTDLVYIGNCGTGFSDASLKEMHALFQTIKTDNCPFYKRPILSYSKGKPVWLKPELVCSVKFLDWTNDRNLRNPVFAGLREDKEVSEVKMEMENPESTIPANEKTKEKVITIGKIQIKCTNLTKIYWPEEGISKGELIDYYHSIGKWLLPYLKNRPLSLNRHPNGIYGESFYQKDMNPSQIPAWLKTEKIKSKSNDAGINYLICNNLATLIYMTNLGCIEINPWHSVILKPELPDYMILDLDPGNIDFIYVVKTALEIKNIFDQLEIKCFCKTSGATGLHIYIPLGAKYTYEESQIFGKLIATLTNERLPEITSLERTVSKRKDKIYLDFLQNKKGQTIAAPYSVRPRLHATVSTPLHWTEVNSDLHPENFHMNNTENRLTDVGDIWNGVLDKGINLSKVLLKIDSIHIK